MKKKIYFIIIFALILLPLLGTAEEISPSFEINSIINGFISGNQATSPNIGIKKFDLIWSTDTYTPINYVGRALPVRGSKIFIDADISIINGNLNSLKYSWFLEDIFQKNKSGYGKNSFYFYAQQLSGNYHTVRVQVFNEDRTIFQEKTIKIPITKPEVVLSRTNNNQVSIVAKPYFFSINKLTDLEFRWTLSGQNPIVSSNYNASILDINVINKNVNEKIEQQLSLIVKNLKETEQNAYGSIKINL